MHPQLMHRETLYQSRQDILCKHEIIHCSKLNGALSGMYPLLDQCRIALIGAEEDCGGTTDCTKWLYGITMPLMFVGQICAERIEIHLTASLCTPFSEEKMRYGCQLQCDCDVFPRGAVELEPGVYRLSFDAHISLFSLLMRAG